MTHQRRTKEQTEHLLKTWQYQYVKINFWPTEVISNMLSAYLVNNQCKVYHASGDANLLIVQKAVDQLQL